MGRSVPSESTASQRLRAATIAFVSIALPVSITLTSLDLRSSLRRQSTAATAAGRAATAGLEHEVTLHEHAVEAIVANAEQLLDGRVKPTVDVVDHLTPSHGGYTMGLLPGCSALEIGSLMGEGPPPARGTAAAAEMAMAVSLSPGFQVLGSGKGDIPWAYYISRRGFLYIYPRAQGDEFLWSHTLLDRYSDQAGSAPLRADGRRMGWSAVYSDNGGKGLMTTLSRLVVHRGEVMGDVSVDVGVRTLVARLDLHGLPNATVHLLDATGREMLPRGVLPGPFDVRSAPRGRPIDVGGAEVSVFTVAPTGWNVAVVLSKRAMLTRALRESSVHGLLVLFTLSSLVLLAALVQALKRLAAISVRDPLTGVYNRRHFDEFMEGELSKARRGRLMVGLAILDIDYFKKFNDRYGHHAGDRALRSVADALQAALRRESDVLFRVGGEEFAVTACIERPEQMQQLCEKLCACIRALDIAHDGSPIGHMTVSIGATTIDAATWVDIDTAYQHADAALYRAKEAGRDGVAM